MAESRRRSMEEIRGAVDSGEQEWADGAEPPKVRKTILGAHALSSLETHEDEKEDVLRDTSVSDDVITDYFKAIRKAPLLNAEQEVELAKSIEAGLYANYQLEQDSVNSDSEREDLEKIAALGQSAKEAFLNSNLRLVVSIAKGYCNRGLSFADLIQEGNLGLVRAVEKFDYNRGYKFSTYASHWVHQALDKAIKNKSQNIRLPIHKAERVRKIGVTQAGLTDSLGRSPTLVELAKELDQTQEAVAEALDHKRLVNTVSLSQPLGDNGGELRDVIADKKAVSPEQSAMEQAIGKFAQQIFEVAGLKPVLQQVVVLHFGLAGEEPMGIKEIAEHLGRTKGSVDYSLKTAKILLENASKTKQGLDEIMRIMGDA